MSSSPDERGRSPCAVHCPACGQSVDAWPESAVLKCASCGATAFETRTGVLEVPRNQHTQGEDELYPM